jgi:hypothetical protein
MPDVAFCRTLKRGNAGRDVIAHKIALSRWNPTLYPWTGFTEFFGGELETTVKKFQIAKGLKADGIIGPATHEKLELAKNKDGEPVFDARSIELAKNFCTEYEATPEKRMREAIVAAAMYWYSKRYQIPYSQYRPFQLGRPPWVPSRWDCSGFVTACYYAAKAPDPNGRGYDGQGYTGTLMNRGTKATYSNIKLGDLIFYYRTTSPSPAFPYGSPKHVAVYVGNGMVASHGRYPMGYYRWDYAEVNHIRTYDLGV